MTTGSFGPNAGHRSRKEASDGGVASPREPVDSGASPACTGKALVAFFRRSPFVGEEIDFVRDESTGRSVDLS